MSSFGRVSLSRIAVILLTAAAVTLAGAVAIYVNVTRLVWAEHWVRHTLEVHLVLERSVMAVISAERAARGFVLTEDREFIDQYTAAVRDAQDAVYRLQRLTRGNDVQQSRIQRLGTQMQQVLAWSSNLVGARSGGNGDAAARKVATGQGYEMTASYRASIKEMQKYEEALLAERTALAERTRRHSLIALGIVTIVSLLALPLLGFAVRREARRIAQADRAGIETSFGTASYPTR